MYHCNHWTTVIFLIFSLLLCFPSRSSRVWVLKVNVSGFWPFPDCWIWLQNGDAGAMEFTQNIFKHIMWRSSKVHISEELQIPPQEERVSWISLSPIEENFYQRQYDTCVGFAREIISSFKEDFRKRNVSGCRSCLLNSYFIV